MRDTVDRKGQRRGLRTQRGVTLVELIVSIVIISIALAGVLTVMNYTTGHSADPMIQHQAVAIAEAYLEEIELQAYSDPGGPVETGRADLDDVDDYDKDAPYGINDQSPPQDQNGAEMTSLAGYQVTVEIEPITDFGPAGSDTAKKISVRVRYGNEVDLTLVGYRTEY
ncbi:MAG: prepilin-type N-terminal cleavage/methylation domain-containing protein [Desulfuromonadaceae bacterium]|nr:prepilin-type N-terminal cleavage/methylation domain-containing protein [Desulfuromonadaceae bacterium]